MSTLATSEYWCRSTPDDLRREIARRIADLRAKGEIAKALSSERLQFKSLWNCSLAINQLPDELLIEVFKFVMAHYKRITTVARQLSYIDIGWPRSQFWELMMVCRHWREVIVGTPAFWCLIPVGDVRAEWTDLCLTRSGTAPVHVVAPIPLWNPLRECHIERCQAVCPLVQDRICMLYFEYRREFGKIDPNVLATFPPLFGNGMRGLERLEFRIVHDNRWPYRPTLDIELTCNRFPRLQHLALTGIVAPREPSLYRQLRTLVLETCTHRLSCDRFLDVLASCTTLERLRLWNTLHHLPGDWVQRDPVPWRPLIRLPHLKVFSVADHGAVLTSRFLAQFHILPSVSLGISAIAEDASDVDPPASWYGARSMAAMLPPSFADTLEPLAMPTAIEVWMSFSDGVEVTCSSYASLCMDLTRTSYNGPRPPLEPRRWGSVADLALLLGRAPLTSLWIVETMPDTVSAWESVFRTFALLERLELDGYKDTSPAGVTNVFLGLHAASAGNADGQVACPNLTHIKVTCSGCAPVLEPIHACIRHRGERGSVLVDMDFRGVICSPERSPSSWELIRDMESYTKRLSVQSGWGQG